MRKISIIYNEFKHGDEVIKNKIVAELAMIGNYLLAVGKFIIGIFSLSFFLVASGFYSTGMALSRGVYLKGYEKDDELDKIKKYIMIGVILLASGILYSIYMFRFILTDYVLNLGLIIPIAIATVAFTELVVSIVSFFKARKHKDILYKAVANINLLTAFAAIALTQIALLHSVDSNPIASNVYNGIFGLTVGIIGIIVGIIMVMKGIRLIKSKKTDL